MNDKLTQRYNALRAEYESGQKMIEELDARRAQVVQTMTRIEGALMVLKEMIDAEAGSTPDNGVGAAAERATLLES